MTLEERLKSVDPKVRAALTQDPELGPEGLRALAVDPSVLVRQGALRRAMEERAVEILEGFLLDPDAVVRAELALWEDCPVDLLQRLGEDPVAALRGIASHRLSAQVQTLQVDEPPPFLAEAEPAEEPSSTHKMPRLVDLGPGVLGGPPPVPVAPHRPVVPAPLPPLSPAPRPMVPAPRPMAPAPLPGTGPVPIVAPRPMAPSAAPSPAPGPAPVPVPVPAPVPMAAPAAVKAPPVASPLPGAAQIIVQLTAADKTQSTAHFTKDLIVVGRVMGNDIVLPQGNISKQHCRIFLAEDELYLEDLKSTNGTLVNQQALPVKTPTRITPGDEVTVGSCTLRVSYSPS